MTELTRRRFISGGLALGALSLLAACGGSPSPTAVVVPSTAPSAVPATRAAASATTGAATSPAGTATRATGAASAVASPATGTRTVTTFHGPLAVPASLQRVVSIDFYSALTLLDLGVTPAGVITYAPASLALIRPQYRPILSSLPKIGSNAETDVEAVAVLRPDLIIGWSNNVKTYDRLKALAPTAIFEYSNTSWSTFARSVAEVAGQTQPFAALVKQYEDRAGTIKQTYSATLGRVKWAIVSGGGSTDWILPNPNSTNAMGALALAGAQLVPSQAAITTPQNLSFEQINQLADADVILYPASPEGEPAASMVNLLNNQLFKALKASQAAHVYPLAYYNSGNYSGALGALDSFEAALKKL